MNSCAPEISVVVATRNRASRLAGLLRSLRAQTLAADCFEVVVVDDDSSDATADVLAEASQSDEPRVLALHGSGDGPAGARNAGWRAARSSLIAFTDDDCEPTPDWLEQSLAAAKEHPGAIIQGPTTPIPREVGQTGPFTRTNVITQPGPSFETCNIVYPRDLLERLNGFDERFPEALGEDTDLGWRARELGGELRWCARARVHHAVENVGPVGFLRSALMGRDAVLAFRRHPGLRAELRWGLFRNGRLPWLATASTGIVLARRFPLLGAALALPYVRHLAKVCARQRASFLMAPYYALWDLLFLYTALRGSLRHRTLVL